MGFFVVVLLFDTPPPLKITAGSLLRFSLEKCLPIPPHRAWWGEV